MGAFSRGKELFQVGSYLIILYLEWAIIRVDAYLMKVLSRGITVLKIYILILLKFVYKKL